MKSTLKIVTVPYGNGLKPVIKIVRSTATIHQSDQSIIDDEDPRDELINQFLKNPCNEGDYDWFKINTSYPVPFGNQNPTHQVTTIAPVEENDLFFRFRHAILGRVVPYEDHVKINRGEVPDAQSEERLRTMQRPVDRLDLSLEKFKKINEFFNWLDETGYCTWEEQQPDLEKANRNSAIFQRHQQLSSNGPAMNFDNDPPTI